MIDAIEDGPDDRCDVDEPGPSWFDCPMLPRGDMLAVIERRKDLNGRGINLFRNALKGQPRSDLFEHFLGPNLFSPGSHHMYTTPDPSRIWFKNWRSAVQIFSLTIRLIRPASKIVKTKIWNTSLCGLNTN